MPDISPNIGLEKPKGNEYVKRENFNRNYDILDTKLGDHEVRLQTVESQIEETTPLPMTMQRGLQVVNVPKDTPFNVLNIRGRTLINLLGRDGNCEGTSKFPNTTTATASISTALKSIGTSSIQVVAIGAGSTEHYVDGVQTPVTSGKYYIAVADATTSGNAARPMLRVYGTGFDVSSYISPTNQVFSPVYVKFSPTSTTTANVRLQLRNGALATVYTQGGEAAFFDAIRIYEISATDYAAIDSMTPEQIAAKYPYQEGIVPIQNPYMIRYGADGMTVEDYLFFQTKLYSNVDRTVFDEVIPDVNGQHRKRKWFEEVVLDGSFAYVFVQDYVGYKRIAVPNPAGYLVPTSGLYGIKYDGKALIADIGVASAADQLSNNTQYIYLTIADTDSGWGENYTPTQAEIQAYFYGWRMYQAEGGVNTPYNGTGTKAWYDPVTTNTTATVPTTKATWYTPYKLVYQRSQSVEEPITAEGGISLKAGANVLEVGEGVVVRELANPKLFDATVGYLINYNGGQPSAVNTLLYRAQKILKIYKNTNQDNKWKVVDSASAYGNQRADIPQSDFDPAAAYSVTYLVLDRYAFTTPIDTITGEYRTNIGGVVSELTRDMADLETRVSIVEKTKANKQQGQWLPAVLQNGWTNRPGQGAARYYKSDLGEVELQADLTGGVVTNGTIIWTMPAGLRPKQTINCTVMAYNGTSWVVGSVYVATNGAVTLETGANAILRINAKYRAEQ